MYVNLFILPKTPSCEYKVGFESYYWVRFKLVKSKAEYSLEGFINQ